MKITEQQLEVFKRNFSLHDKFGNEEVESIKYIHWIELLNQYLIGVKLNEGSTEFGFKNSKLIVGGVTIHLDGEDLDQVESFIASNKSIVENCLV